MFLDPKADVAITGTVKKRVRVTRHEALTITSTGVVAPASKSSDAIIVSNGANGAYILNQGQVLGAASDRITLAGGIGLNDFGQGCTVNNVGIIAAGAGADVSLGPSGMPIHLSGYPVAGNGGIGVVLASGATLTNDGAIAGGKGGSAGLFRYDPKGTGGVAGAGIYLKGDGKIANDATISGGTGGYGYKVSGAAGDGILATATDTIVNTGIVRGGVGGGGGRYSSDPISQIGGAGAVGIALNAGSLLNSGLIFGGAGGLAYSSGGVGGIGVSLTAANLCNTGSIYGGDGGQGNGQEGGGGAGALGVSLGAGNLSNGGAIYGGNGGAGTGFYGYGGYGGAAGSGVAFDGPGTLINTGHIKGGDSGAAGRYAGSGRAGVGISGIGTIINSGVVGGGEGAGIFGKGGAGVILGSGTLDNAGLIYGGSAYYEGGFFPIRGGQGADGVDLLNCILSNSGTILGADVYNNYAGSGVYLNGGTIVNVGDIAGGNQKGGYYAYGSAGDGIIISHGEITNFGTLTGGSSTEKGYGGVGVYLKAGTLTNFGTISGGYGGAYQHYGHIFDAVQCGPGAATVMVGTGAVFNGLVSGDDALVNSLDFAANSTSSNALYFTGFGTVQIGLDGTWTLTGSGALTVGGSLIDEGDLLISGSLTDPGTAILTSGAALQSSGHVTIGSLSMSEGTLTSTEAGTIIVGPQNSDATAGSIVVEAGAVISGSGVISSPNLILDLGGTVFANGPGLIVDANFSGSGAAVIAAGADLTVQGTLSVADILFQSGGATLSLGTPASVSSTLSSFGANDVIDLLQTQATSLTFIGGVLDVTDGAQLVASFSLSGSYSAADFALIADGAGGTDIIYTAGDASFAQPSIPHVQKAEPYGPFYGTSSPAGRWTHLLPDIASRPIL